MRRGDGEDLSRQARTAGYSHTRAVVDDDDDVRGARLGGDRLWTGDEARVAFAGGDERRDLEDPGPLFECADIDDLARDKSMPGQDGLGACA